MHQAQLGVWLHSTRCAPPPAAGSCIRAPNRRAAVLPSAHLAPLTRPLAVVCLMWTCCGCAFTVPPSAVACLLTYLSCSFPRPFVQYCACFFLLYELSTPFMHVRQFCIMLGKTDTLLFKMANVLFPLAFFLCRIVAGLVFSWDWAFHQWDFLHNDPRRDTASVLICYYLYVAVRAHCDVQHYWRFSYEKCAFHGASCSTTFHDNG
jgi:hypothetical protein